MSVRSPSDNKAAVLRAFDLLFDRRDDAAAKTSWSPTYIPYSAHIASGREGRFDLLRSLPCTLRDENQLILAEGDFVIVHGRVSGVGRPTAWIDADIPRFDDGLLSEHLYVPQCHATQSESLSGLPMFGTAFSA